MNARPTTRAALSIAGGLAALLTLTACGGDSSADAAAEATTAAGGAVGCPRLRRLPRLHGRERRHAARDGRPPAAMPTAAPSAMPSGGPGAFPGGLPDGVDQETFDTAQAACADLAPAFGPGRAGGPVGSGTVDATAMAAFQSCLSDNGVTVAEGQDPIRDLDRSDPDVKAAMDTCSPLLPVPTPAESG